MFLYIVHGLLVGYHREVVAVQLEDLVVDLQTRLTRCTLRSDLCHVDPVISVALDICSLPKKQIKVIRSNTWGLFL